MSERSFQFLEFLRGTVHFYSDQVRDFERFRQQRADVGDRAGAGKRGAAELVDGDRMGGGGHRVRGSGVDQLQTAN